jgi:hypothetical protein
MQSQNGWPVLAAESRLLHTWTIPAHTGEFTLRLRNGSAGFLLAVFALWFAEVIQPVRGKVLDDWGWSPLRNVRGGESVSNHCSGTAIDLNARAHGLGLRDTFTPRQVRQIHRKLRRLHGVIRWGGDYIRRQDQMHDEIVQTLVECEREAKRQMLTPRGRRVLKANPGQRQIINT